MGFPSQMLLALLLSAKLSFKMGTNSPWRAISILQLSGHLLIILYWSLSDNSESQKQQLSSERALQNGVETPAMPPQRPVSKDKLHLFLVETCCRKDMSSGCYEKGHCWSLCEKWLLTSCYTNPIAAILWVISPGWACKSGKLENRHDCICILVSGQGLLVLN